MAQKNSTLYLIGAGPGDPGLLTLKAREILRRAEIIFYDHLVNPEILAHAASAKKTYVGKIGHEDAISQQEIQNLLREAVRNHAVVVRLKGGDPFLFGRGGEEAEFLAREGIRFEVVPGVSSALAVPAYAGIPLTHREHSSSVRILTGHEDPQKQRFAPPAYHPDETLVYLMGVKHLQKNFAALLAQGWPAEMPAAAIRWGTYPEQRSLVGTLKTLPDRVREEGFEAPVVFVVGKVVSLRTSLNWCEGNPLFGKNIWVTRAPHQSETLSEALRAAFAKVVLFPSVALTSVADDSRQREIFSRLGSYDGLVFTSANVVDHFFSRLGNAGLDARRLAGAKIAVIGGATEARLKEKGLFADFRPELAEGKALVEALAGAGLRRVLLPRPDVANAEIGEALTERGLEVDEWVLYRKEVPRYESSELTDLLKRSFPDLLTFTSGSTVENFAEIFRGISGWEKLKTVPCAVLGRTAWERARKEGFQRVKMSAENSVESLLEKIFEFF